MRAATARGRGRGARNYITAPTYHGTNSFCP